MPRRTAPDWPAARSGRIWSWPHRRQPARFDPGAEPDDGLFDVLLIGDLTKRDLLLTLPKTYRGAHLPHPKAEVLRGSSVVVDAPSAVPIELDGEQPGTTPVRFELVPKALRLRVPG